MIFTKAEIDLLRLTAWCKDLPAGHTNIYPPEIVELLCSLGLLRRSRNALSYRVTPFGYEMLRQIGCEYPADKQYRGKGPALSRRLNTSLVTAFFWRYGANVFCEVPAVQQNEVSFLPSFVLRRKTSSNILGGSRLAGFLYTEQFTCVPYFITAESAGIYAEVEERTFSTETLLGNRKPMVLFTGYGTIHDILKALTSARQKNEKTTTDTYQEAIKKFHAPCAIVPLEEDGARQLRVMLVPGWQKRVLKSVLRNDYLPPEDLQCDGRSQTTGDSFIVGFDCNIVRFEAAAIRNRGNTHVILFPNQASAVQNYLRGRDITLHSIDIQTIEQVLGIPAVLPAPDLSPFKTKKGEYLYAPAIQCR